MSTKTTFDGYMEFDPDNLLLRITNWLKEPLPDNAWPGSAQVHHRDPDAQSWALLVDLPIASKPKSASVLRDEIRAAIVNKKGPEPIGYFRIRISTAGRRASPDVDFHRCITDFDVSSKREGEVYKELYLRERQRTAELMTCVVTQHSATTTMLGTWGGHMASLSTARVTGSVGADLGSPMAIFGMVAWLVAFPALKKAMGLPPDADMATVVRVGQALIERQLANGQQPEAAGGGYTLDGPGPAVKPTEEPAAESAANTSLSVVEIIDRAEKDESWRDQLIAEMRRRKPLMAKMKELALQAISSGDF